jgi:hypothetical protein
LLYADTGGVKSPENATLEQYLGMRDGRDTFERLKRGLKATRVDAGLLGNFIQVHWRYDVYLHA